MLLNGLIRERSQGVVEGASNASSANNTTKWYILFAHIPFDSMYMVQSPAAARLNPSSSSKFRPSNMHRSVCPAQSQPLHSSPHAYWMAMSAQVRYTCGVWKEFHLKDSSVCSEVYSGILILEVTV